MSLGRPEHEQCAQTIKQRGPKSWHIRTLSELGGRVEDLSRDRDIIEGLTPARSVNLVIGQSSLGKTPLLYQAGISVGADRSFLGQLAVQQGRVLYLDGENSILSSLKLAHTLTEYLKLPECPDRFRIFSIQDAPTDFGAKDRGLFDMIVDYRPDWVIVDTISTILPRMDMDPVFCGETLALFRRLISEYGISTTLVHHPRKGAQKKEERWPRLDEADNINEWFECARGASTLIYGTDARIAIDRPSEHVLGKINESIVGDVALAMGGYQRVSGEFPLRFIARDVDEDGEPAGYRLVNGIAMLDKHDQGLFDRMPGEFRFKEARLSLGYTSKRKVQKFLKHLIACGLIKKEDKLYRKVATPVR